MQQQLASHFSVSLNLNHEKVWFCRAVTLNELAALYHSRIEKKEIKSKSLSIIFITNGIWIVGYCLSMLSK